jgi:uncharacterized Ntn-hydrolase superfamily protein
VTFSIVARDQGPAAEIEWGVAVASKFLAVGAAVPFARAGAGALATQAMANLAYGPDGLEQLGAGRDAPEVVRALTVADPDREHRQLGIVDAQGETATFTGDKCLAWAGGRTGDGYCCQGNILAGPEVIDRMAEAFEITSGPLRSRLVAALAAGDEAGGDRRGRQSAALLVVRAQGGYAGGSDRAVDLRVDDHLDPIPELVRLLGLHRLYFPSPEEMVVTEIDDDLAAELRERLSSLAYEPGDGSGYDEELKDALLLFAGTENLEERWVSGARIERGLLEFLREHS